MHIVHDEAGSGGPASLHFQGYELGLDLALALALVLALAHFARYNYAYDTFFKM